MTPRVSPPLPVEVSAPLPLITPLATMAPLAAVTEVAPFTSSGRPSVWVTALLLVMFPVRVRRLPPRVKPVAPELKVMLAKLVSAARSLFGVGRVVPANCRSSPALGTRSESQFAPVDQLLSPPPPSHTRVVGRATSVRVTVVAP